MNPVETFLTSKTKTAMDRKEREMEMWKNWNTQGRKPDDLKPLLDSYRNVLANHSKKYVRKYSLPEATIHADLQKNFLNALKTYDPSYNVQLNTHVENYLKKTFRYVGDYANIGKIPETQRLLINKYYVAKDELSNHLDRDPTADEIAKHLGKKPKQIKQLQIELSRKDLASSGFEEDPAVFTSPKELQAIRLLRYDSTLTPEERAVYNHTFGVHNDEVFVEHKMLKPGEIAKKLNMNNAKVSRIRNSLAKKVREISELDD